jgi:hypothetical protein
VEDWKWWNAGGILPQDMFGTEGDGKQTPITLGQPEIADLDPVLLATILASPGQHSRLKALCWVVPLISAFVVNRGVGR